jgi:hypothetical protein
VRDLASLACRTPPRQQFRRNKRAVKILRRAVRLQKEYFTGAFRHRAKPYFKHSGGVAGFWKYQKR